MGLVEKSTPSDFRAFRNPHPKKDKIREFVAVLVIDLVEKVEKSEKSCVGQAFLDIVSVVRGHGKPVENFRRMWKDFSRFRFVETVENHPCGKG